MTTLRMTRPDTDTPPRGGANGRHRLTALALCGLLAAITGCGEQRPEADPPAFHADPAASLPPPATDRIDYDARTRTLTFYDLQGPGRWMVTVAGAIHPAGPDHRLPEGVDPEKTYVSYVRPSGQTSVAVSLSQIQAAREMHKSQPR